MLLRLEIENFYSVRDRQVLDFRVPDTTPDVPRYSRCYRGRQERAPHVLAVFGANASGKTNFLRALTFMLRFASRSFDDYDPGEDLVLLPFKSADSKRGITKLAMEFAPSRWMLERFFAADAERKPAGLYRYELELDHSGKTTIVSREALHHVNTDKFFTTLFERELKGDEYEIKANKDFDLSKSDPRRSVRKNVSLISSLVQFEHKPSILIKDMFDHSFFTNISIHKWTKSEEDVTDFLSESSGMLEMLNRKIRVIDVGIEKVEIMEVSGKKVPVFHHVGLDDVLTFAFESDGTKSFYLNFVDLTLALGSGGVAIMDELDADLHPNLMSEIIRWFQDSHENPFGAQLVTSCHNASVISNLEKEEVLLAMKNDSGESTISSLSSLKGLRRDANLYAKYLSGEFGAVPRLG